MDPRTVSLCLGTIALALSGAIYGAKFIRKKNYLLGIEWFVLAFSSSNTFVYFVTLWPNNLHVAHFFDAFSRGFGVPVVATAGLMVVTNGYRPTVFADVAYFIASFIGTLFLVYWTVMSPILPYFYLAMWALFTVYQVYFIKKLLQYQLKGQAFGMTLAAISSMVIASIYDFYKIPGEETNVIFNFFTLALFTWAYLAAQTYHAYDALDRAMKASADPQVSRKARFSSPLSS
nr:hypothetical protein [Sphingomonas sp. CDS-1]